MQIKMTREQALERLAENLAAAKRYDSQRMIEHRKAEAEAMKIGKQKVAEWAKKIKTAKTYDEYRGAIGTFHEGSSHRAPWTQFYRLDEVIGALPCCPLPQAPRIERVLAVFERDARKTITCSPDGINSDLFAALTFSADPIGRGETCA